MDWASQKSAMRWGWQKQAGVAKKAGGGSFAKEAGHFVITTKSARFEAF